VVIDAAAGVALFETKAGAAKAVSSGVV